MRKEGMKGLQEGRKEEGREGGGCEVRNVQENLVRHRSKKGENERKGKKEARTSKGKLCSEGKIDAKSLERGKNCANFARSRLR